MQTGDESKNIIINIKQNGIKWINKILKDKIIYNEPGSISYLLYGKKISEHSININFRKFSEYLIRELIKTKSNYELLNYDMKEIYNGKRDIYLIFKNNNTKIIYYRELRGNINLDTKHLQNTITKYNHISNLIKSTYSNYIINCGILNWSVYNRTILKDGLINIEAFENWGIKIDHFEDLLNIIGVLWNEHDYYLYFTEIGSILKR